MRFEWPKGYSSAQTWLRIAKSGSYASGSEVIRAGLRALRERDAAIEQWLREEVAAAYDAVKSGKSATHSASDVFEEMRARHAAANKKS